MKSPSIAYTILNGLAPIDKIAHGCDWDSDQITDPRDDYFPLITPIDLNGGDCAWRQSKIMSILYGGDFFYYNGGVYFCFVFIYFFVFYFFYAGENCLVIAPASDYEAIKKVETEPEMHFLPLTSFVMAGNAVLWAITAERLFAPPPPGPLHTAGVN